VTEPVVLALFGPTASGKSGVAEEIARRIPAEIVSADSMQAYEGLPILTNQPATPTALVAIWPLSHEGSVGEYQALAHDAIDAALERGCTPVVVGGTGLYLRAALSDLDLPPEPPPRLRERLAEMYERLGPERAHQLLAERDPAAAARIHPNDERRVIRALELTELGSTLHPDDPRLWSGDARHPTVIFGLEVSREELERRIAQRTQRMFGLGVEKEVRRALEGKVSKTARHALGLEEIASFPREEAVEALSVRTRRYAAYQRKWMRRIPGLVSLNADRPAGEIADEILEVARSRQRLPARRAG
jgi:tRNA dimethylallyltransferase